MNQKVLDHIIQCGPESGASALTDKRDSNKETEDSSCIASLKDSFSQLLLRLQEDKAIMALLDDYVSSVNTVRNQSNPSNPLL